MFENVDGRTDAGRTPDAGVTGILIAHLGAFGSGELKKSADDKNMENYPTCKELTQIPISLSPHHSIILGYLQNFIEQ